MKVEIGNVRRRGCSFRNPDWKQSGYLAGLAHAAMCMDADQAAWLAAPLYTMRIPGAIVAHGSLDEPDAFNYIDDDERSKAKLEILRKDKVKVGFVGHTHLQGIIAERFNALDWLDAMRVRIPVGIACVVTVGLVGQPGHATDRRASWVLCDPAENMVEFRRVNYSHLQAAQEIAKAGLPWESALRLLTSEEATFVLTP